MLKKSYRMLGFASIVGLLPGVSTAFAQSSRPWVDPPPTLAAPPAAEDLLTPVPELDPAAMSAIPHPPARPALPEAGHAATHSKRTARAPETPERDQQQASAKNQPRKAETRKRSVRASRDERPRAQTSKRQTFAARAGKRRSVDREASLENGLEIMKLRTIEFPDGRRISVLMPPDPETIRRVLERPEY